VNNDEWARTNIHALKDIRTHVLIVQAFKPYASDHTVTGSGKDQFG
jgi:hypothetical protein